MARIDYLDPNKKVQQGYAVNGQTYMDEAGTQRIPLGSTVATQGGTYILGENGGLRINDATALPAEYYGAGGAPTTAAL